MPRFKIHTRCIGLILCGIKVINRNKMVEITNADEGKRIGWLSHMLKKANISCKFVINDGSKFRHEC